MTNSEVVTGLLNTPGRPLHFLELCHDVMPHPIRNGLKYPNFEIWKKAIKSIVSLFEQTYTPFGPPCVIDEILMVAMGCL